MKSIRYPYYVVFTPTCHKGIYASWEEVSKVLKAYHRPEYIGIWSQKQASMILNLDFASARKFKEKMVGMGLNTPQYPPPVGMPRMEW